MKSGLKYTNSGLKRKNILQCNDRKVFAAEVKLNKQGHYMQVLSHGRYGMD